MELDAFRGDLDAWLDDHAGELAPAHRGLGTASCGPDTLPRYVVRPGTFRWSWSIRPL